MLAVTEKSITQWVNIYRNLYAQHEYLVRLFEGTHETLAYLHACKYRLILVSNKAEQQWIFTQGFSSTGLL